MERQHESEMGRESEVFQAPIVDNGDLHSEPDARYDEIGARVS